MSRSIRSLWRNADGAVAPVVALSLVGLIATGGLAFDYAHMAALDTELQDAADQAALAAATQLDGSADSRTRATAAAQSLLSNLSLFASDAGADTENDRKVTIASVNFYQSYDDATDTYGDPATGDSNARVVEVTVGGRRADFALTPIVAAFTSGTVSAKAAASLSSAICNVPPLMICAPTSGTFPDSSSIGEGVLLQPGPQTGAWAPGDYGYLDFGNGASGLATNLGKNNEASGCVDTSNGVATEPGNKASVTDALNSRLDLYPAGAATCDPTTGDYCPAQNTRKDELMTEQVDVTVPKDDPAPANPGCAAAGAKVIGKSNSTDTNGFVQSAAAKGFTRDTCHIGGGCANGNFGNGAWDRDGYFAALHPGQLAAAATWAGKTVSTITRFDVYKWELADTANRQTPQQTDITVYDPASKDYYKKVKGANATYTFTNQCAYPSPKNGTGVAVSSTQKDRRILTAAAVDCTGLNGRSNVVVRNWVDMFLVEPSLDRTAPYATGKSQIYVEIISATRKPDGQSAYQFYLRQRPRLIR